MDRIDRVEMESRRKRDVRGTQTGEFLSCCFDRLGGGLARFSLLGHGGSPLLETDRRRTGRAAKRLVAPENVLLPAPTKVKSQKT
jgi:hypothetical protein